MDKEERFNYYINKKDDRDWFIDDRVKEEEITTFKGVVQVLNQQQRIAELEEQLENAPKYTVYSKVFFVDDCEKTIKEDFVEQITINHRDGILYELINNFLFEESELFATKEEAEAKLQELQGEKK